MGDRTFTSERASDVALPVDEVRRLLLDPQTWPRWQPEIVEAHGPAPMAAGDVARGRARMLGFGVHGHSEATDVGEGFFEEDVIVGVRMTIRYELAASPAGTRVTHRLVATLPAGVSGRVLSLFLRPRLRALQRRVLAELAAQARS